MRLIRDIATSPLHADGCAIAIGNFDGVHRGHRALIDRAGACRPGLRSAVMCFEPLPATFFHPTLPVTRLSGTGERLRLLRDTGLDLVFMLRFNAQFAALSPRAFVEDVLVAGVGARQVIVGEDFRFGHRRAGDVSLLQQFGTALGFEVAVVAPVLVDGERVSSTAIRQALAVGDLDRAARFLGRRYHLGGRVIRGQQLGRKLGYPTVNLRVPSPPALTGVYAVTVTGAGLCSHPGVASLGRRPTVAGREWLLEVHLFDIERDLYGCQLVVEFVQFLRHEQTFGSLAAMTEQMMRDEAQARNVLNITPLPE